MLVKDGILFAAIGVLALLMQGCGSAIKYNPLPSQLESAVQMPGMHDVRAWGDTPSKVLEKSAIQSIVQEKAANHGRRMDVLNVLALSGGGSDGAFGAGYLCGWTRTGKRPTFKLVTGISTGALISPFAFLGSTYDAKLKELYTTMSDEKIYKQYSLFTIVLALTHIKPLPSLASNQPLADLIKNEVNMDMLKKIAAEHKKGRRLLVGTTQFNAQRLVIWNMGEIATIGTPNALKLFQDILLASSAIPVTFPPQIFNVEANGKPYQEMHVDGGIEVQLMLYENALLPFQSSKRGAEGNEKPRRLFIIRNERIYPEWEDVKPQLADIALRSIGSLTKSQGVGDLYRLYTYSLRDGLEYNLAYIPSTFHEQEATPFDNTYMRKVFDLGFKMAKSGTPWMHSPPGYDPE